MSEEDGGRQPAIDDGGAMESGGSESPQEVLRELGLSPKEFRRYAKAVRRLREMERKYGKNYQTLLRDYEKKFKEWVKMEYAINELREKRSKIEEDLKIYLDQHKLTLENVNRTVRILSALEKYGANLDDLEGLARAVSHLKDLGMNVGEILSMLSTAEEFKREIRILEEQRKSYESKLAELAATLEEKEMILRDIVGAENTLSDLGELRRKLEGEIDEYERKIEEQTKLLEELAREYETLAGLKGSAHEIYRELQERKAMIQKLDEEIARKGETLKVLEEEVEAARSLLTLMQDPENIRSDDLEVLSQQLLNIVKVRSGELPMLKPLEDSLLQNARKKVVELVWPAIRNEFVPKWVFDKLEKEMKEMIVKKTQLEQELEKLGREVEELRKRTEAPQQPMQQQPAKTEEEKAREFRLRSTGRALASIDKKVNVKCSLCSAYNMMYLPKYEEYEAAKNEKDKLTLNCISCGKAIFLEPSALDRFYRGGGVE